MTVVQVCKIYILHINTSVVLIFLTGQPYVYRMSYNNLIEDTSNTALATIQCQTQSYLPTWVVWEKNGVEISIDGQSYETLQMVTNRGHSYFRNILIVKDVVGIVEAPLYTCVVGNSAGNTSRSVRVSISIRISLSGTPIHHHCSYIAQ